MPEQRMTHPVEASTLADILERVLDKGIVIAGDITISLVEVELLNIKLRLLVASVDKAMEMGINWWENDPYLSSRASNWRRRTTSSGSDLIAWRRGWKCPHDPTRLPASDDRRLERWSAPFAGAWAEIPSADVSPGHLPGVRWVRARTLICQLLPAPSAAVPVYIPACARPAPAAVASAWLKSR